MTIKGPRKAPLSKRKAIYLAWKRGLLTYKLLPHQHDLFEIISNSTSLKTVINCSRRFGKTTVLLIFCMIFMIKKPGSLIRFGSPTAKSLKKTIIPIMRMLLADCPPELRPKFNKTELVYEWWNGSELHLSGCDGGNEESLRGQRADLGVVDEAGYVGPLRYVLNDILMPQTLTCGGRLLVASTPPEVQDSEFYQICQEAEANNSYFIRTIYDNTSISKETLEKYAKEAGGFDSITFQREYMGKFITETARLLVPEWRDSFIQEIEPDEFRSFYHNYTSMDLGVTRHFTAMNFGYYDFTKGKLIILDESTMLNMTTEDLVKVIKEKESKLFTNFSVYRRIADNNNPLLINDLGYLHNLPFIATNKDTLEAMVNELRIFIGQGRLIVHPRCKMTLGCLKYGCWDEKRSKFAMSPKFGHYDNFASIMYLVRNLDQHTNPIPHLHKKNEATHFIDPKEYERVSRNGEQLTKAFFNRRS